MARLTGQQRRKREEEKRNRIIRKPVKGDTKKVKIKGRTRTRYYDGKKWVDKAVYRETPKLSKIEQKTEELRIRNLANEELLAKNRADLAVKGVSRNWANPVGDELWKEDTMLQETGGWDEVEGGQPKPTTIANLQATNKYKAEKFEKERQAGWAEADLQDARDLKIGSKAGMTEWTTDQKASDQGSLTAIPPDKGGKGGVSESKASGNNSNFKSDIFTINPETGKAVGVLTRSQRRAFEKKYGNKLDKLKIRTYRNKGNTYQRYG